MRKLAWTKASCLALWFSLQLVFAFKTLILPMAGREPNVTMWLVHALPLLPFLPGLLRGQQRTYLMLSLFILMYFMVTVDALFSSHASIYHWLTLVLVVMLFLASLLFTRWSGPLAEAPATIPGKDQ